ncbi:MAG: hypothetical protein JWN42_2223 [Candidatus Angelobacter sp.]|nr:hypothetical protein [Candidatus Angelobacter sp.]
MAEFCTNCGAPLSGVFCGRCGHRAQSASAPVQPAPSTPTPVASQPPSSPQPTSTHPPIAQQPVPQRPAAQPPKSSGGGKALLIVGGIVLILVLGAFGSVLYGVHWIKRKVSSISGGSFGSEAAEGNMCRLLSTGELQRAIGVTVERSAEITDNGDPGCAYYTNQAAFAQLQKLAMEQARRDSERVSNEPGANANSKNDNPLELLKHTKEMEGIVKGLGLSQPDATGRVFAFSVNRNFGSGNWWPLRTTLSAVPGFDEVNGIGDHAMIGSWGHAFYVLKGDSMFKLETMYLPEARARGSDIANKIVSHL